MMDINNPVLRFTTQVLLLSNLFTIAEGASRQKPIITYTSQKESLRGYILCPTQRIKLKCARDEIIKIHFADYGRQHPYICGRGSTIFCSTKITTTAKMKEMCEGVKDCQVTAAQGVFKDACPGEKKYLHVIYKCEKKREESGTPRQKVINIFNQPKDDSRSYILCPRQRVELKCEKHETIKIRFADYGRQNRFICGGVGSSTIDCSSKQTTTVKMREMCEGKRNCQVSAGQGVFKDACPGEKKYLHVVYKCVKTLTMVKKREKPVINAPGADFSQCGISKSTRVRTRVVEGKTSVPGTWPWQVLLLKGYNRKRFSCSGTLIHPSWVLTAAHCIRSRKKNFYTVRLGDFDRLVNESKEEDILVKRTIRHPRYFTPYPLNNDIALLELERPATFSERVGVACLPKMNYELPINDPETRCYITGWGRSRHKGHMSQLLREVEVPPVSRAKCAVRLAKSPGGKNRKITKQMICGGDDNTGASACQGDSGGPYVCRNKEGYWEVQGVVSWGSPICSLKQRFTVMAQVSKFRKWIDKHVHNS